MNIANIEYMTKYMVEATYLICWLFLYTSFYFVYEGVGNRDQTTKCNLLKSSHISRADKYPRMGSSIVSWSPCCGKNLLRLAPKWDSVRHQQGKEEKWANRVSFGGLKVEMHFLIKNIRVYGEDDLELLDGVQLSHGLHITVPLSSLITWAIFYFL